MQNQNKLSTRLLSLALSAAMALTTFPVAAFAVEGNTAPQATSGNTTTTRAITAFGELGEGFAKSVPFDGHTYVLDVKENTPLSEVKLPTELSVTVEKITTTATAPAAETPVVETPVVSEATSTEPATPTTDADTTVLGNEPATPSGAEPAPVEKPAEVAPPVAKPGNATIIETTQENVPVTWKGDKEYTAEPSNNVVYTAVLPEGYALKDGTILPIINVMVGKKVMTPKSATSRAATPVQVGTAEEFRTAINSVAADTTIKLTATIDLGSTGITTPSNNVSFTIDLNGNTLTSTVTTIKHSGAGTLTIADSSNSTGTLKTTCTSPGNIYTIQNASTGTISVTGGTVSAPVGFGYSVICNSGSGTVSVAGGIVTITSGKAILNENTGAINVTGGTVSATTGIAIHNTGTGAINVSGGTVSATTGKAINNLNTGAINVSGGATVTSANDKTNSGTIYFFAVPTEGDKVILTVNGGAQVTNTATPEGFSAYFNNGIKATDYYTFAEGATLGRVYPVPSKNITFDSRGGSAVADVEIGDTMTLPTEPTWTGYTFDGWYSGIDGTNATTSPAFTGKLTLETAKALTANTTVYAKWTKGVGGKMVRTTPLDLSTAGADIDKLTTEGWKWDSTTKTLTLDGANIKGENSVGSTGLSNIELYAVKLPVGATVNLVDGSESNLIGGNCTGSDAANIGSYGIYVKNEGTPGILTINGTGTLNTLGGDVLGNQAGNSCGIYSFYGISIVSGTINATGGTVVSTYRNGTSHSSSTGITAAGQWSGIVIEEKATVTATGGNATYTCITGPEDGAAVSDGIENEDGNIICRGKVNVAGGTAICYGTDGQPILTKQMSLGTFSDSIMFTTPAIISAKGATNAILTISWITADGATVTGAKESFENNATAILTQKDPAVPVEISFGPSIAVAAQSGIATYGAAANPTFVVTGSNFGGKYPAFAPKIEWVGTAPTGVTTAFTGTSNETLTVTTTAATPAGDYKFKVVSPKATPETGNYESAEATLTVGKREVTIAWDTTTSFVYDGNSHAPTATVSNAVNGDVLTVTVTGGQANVGDNHTATASALAGTAAGNYKLPTAATTTTFAITAKPVTVNDGTLEVKKPHDDKTDAGTATGNLGLTGVLDADKDNVSVSIDAIGVYADANIGKDKTVTLTISLTGSANGNYTLSNSSYNFTKAEITKKAYTGTAAAAPNGTPTTKGDKSITIATVTPPTGENVEYAISTTSTAPTSDKDWQTGTTFNNLNPNTEYFFFARIKEGTNHAAGGVSAGVSITTDRSDYTGTQATAPTATKTHDTVTLNTQTISGEAVEYGIKNSSGTITWQDSATFSGLTADTEYKFYTRVKANGTHKAGATSAATAIKTQKAPVDVKGTVTDSKGTTPLANVTVELKQGDTVIKSAKTAADGSYTLAAVPAGVYKLVITKGVAPNTVTITETVTVDGTPITGHIVKFLNGDKNTIVDSKPGAPTVAVDGMNDLLNDTNIDKTLTPAEKAAVDANGSVELKFTADLKPLNENATDKSELESIAGNQKIDLLLDLSVLKIVKDASGKTITDGEKITDLAGLITVHLPIPANMQGKAGLSLYRMHNGKPEKLSTTADANGEYYTVDTSGEFMTLYLKKFSTYAMGYNAFTVAMQNGGTGASGNGNYSNGDVVTISAGTKSGYSFSGWTVTVGNVTLVNQSSATTTFTMPAENIVITANWTATGGSTGGNGSSETYYYIKATAGIGGSINTPERVKVLVGESAGFSITPEKGYQIADVKVNGKSIGAKKYYVFTNVLSDQTIHATFKKAGHANPQTGVDVD